MTITPSSRTKVDCPACATMRWITKKQLQSTGRIVSFRRVANQIVEERRVKGLRLRVMVSVPDFRRLREAIQHATQIFRKDSH
ncbi:MAG TPA: hypothetical protein VGU61_02920 [Noviherbaspirillum sp.]|jgi:hypothetical protein|uniref:hypothetical protein n=1 Tax=Noviherbaspirillum sp. TaxID=1926288 RepID=UPI002DDCAA1A|nr:hypothetical protein [Noviherbaspirillum sp.]HEV2609197.1 hypothetical protein [Noviherbaspirillum sp.]